MSPSPEFYNNIAETEKALSSWKEASLPTDDPCFLRPNYQFLAKLERSGVEVLCFVKPDDGVLGAGSICIPLSHDYEKGDRLYKLHKEVCGKNWKALNFTNKRWSNRDLPKGLDAIGVLNNETDKAIYAQLTDGWTYGDYTAEDLYEIIRNPKLLVEEWREFNPIRPLGNDTIVSVQGLVKFVEEKYPGMKITPLKASSYLKSKKKKIND